MVLPTPYQLTKEPNRYTFTTDNAFEYQLILTNYDEVTSEYTFLKGRLYDLSFYPLGNLPKKKMTDHRVMATVFHLATRFFSENPENLLLVTYDSLDQRHLQRERLFDMLFGKYHPEIRQSNGFGIGFTDYEIKTGEEAPKKISCLCEGRSSGTFGCYP